MKVIENTFAPHVENKTLTVGQIIVGLHSRVFDFDTIPEHVQELVRAELDKRYNTERQPIN